MSSSNEGAATCGLLCGTGRITYQHIQIVTLDSRAVGHKRRQIDNHASAIFCLDNGDTPRIAYTQLAVFAAKFVGNARQIQCNSCRLFDRVASWLYNGPVKTEFQLDFSTGQSRDIQSLEVGSQQHGRKDGRQKRKPKAR